MEKIPFVAGPRNACALACHTMIAQTFFPEVTFDDVAFVNRWESGYVVHEYPFWNWLMDRNIQVITYDPTDLSIWAEEGLSYLEQTLPENEFKFFVDNTRDMDLYLADVRKNVTHPLFQRISRSATMSDLVDGLKVGVCAVVLNPRVLNGGEGFALHQVIVTSVTSDSVVFHDPSDLHPEANRTENRELFEAAWLEATQEPWMCVYKKSDGVQCVEGIFALHKPLKMTSQRAVQHVKFWARAKTGNKKVKVGHGGTLDPLAEGVLVVAVGRTFTKQIDIHVAAEKEYIAEMTFGATSTTDDAEGEKTVREVISEPSEAEIESVLEGFVGDITQIPPAYSAIKIAGQEAYKRVRRGEVVEMRAREVRVETIEILSYAYPVLSVRVVCGKGTYIRSLARDIGETLGVGAYLSGLVRSRVGDFLLKDCKTIEDFEQR